jgi:hypothetical protein
MAGSTAAVSCYSEFLSLGDTYEIFVSTAEHHGAQRVTSADPNLDSLNLHGDGELLVYNSGRVTRDGVRNAKLWRIVGKNESLIITGPRKAS